MVGGSGGGPIMSAAAAARGNFNRDPDVDYAANDVINGVGGGGGRARQISLATS